MGAVRVRCPASSAPAGRWRCTALRRAVAARSGRQGHPTRAETAVYAGGVSALNDVVWPIRTDRLQIRPLQDADLDAVWEFRRLPEVNRWLGRAPATREASHETYSDPERR